MGEAGKDSGGREVTVWLAEPVAASELLGVLDDGERQRLERFRFERDANSYASAHALTRRLLSSRRPVSPADWRFGTHEFGKPFVTHPEHADLTFNLSHTRGLVAAAVTRDVEVGVDVEAVGSLDLAQELRTRVLSPDESAALDALPREQRAARFFSIWSLKESYIKARGLGLRLPLKEISFGAGAVLEAVPGPDAPADWATHLEIVTAGEAERPHALGVTAAQDVITARPIHVRRVHLLQ